MAFNTPSRATRVVYRYLPLFAFLTLLSCGRPESGSAQESGSKTQTIPEATYLVYSDYAVAFEARTFTEFQPYGYARFVEEERNELRQRFSLKDNERLALARRIDSPYDKKVFGSFRSCHRLRDCQYIIMRLATPGWFERCRGGFNDCQRENYDGAVTAIDGDETKWFRIYGEYGDWKGGPALPPNDQVLFIDMTDSTIHLTNGWVGEVERVPKVTFEEERLHRISDQDLRPPSSTQKARDQGFRIAHGLGFSDGNLSTNQGLPIIIDTYEVSVEFGENIEKHAGRRYEYLTDRDMWGPDYLCPSVNGLESVASALGRTIVSTEYPFLFKLEP